MSHPSVLQHQTLNPPSAEVADVSRTAALPPVGPVVESTVLGSLEEQRAVIPPASNEAGPSSSPQIQAQPSARDKHQPEGSFHVQPPHPSEHEPLATELRPRTSATLTVRVIKSFEFRTQKSLVLKEVDLERVTVGELMERCRNEVKTAPGWKAYRTLQLDTLKLYTVAHGHKTMNLIINLDHDEWILSDHDKTLAEIGAENETELSFFNRQAYETFKANPEIKWD